MTRSRRFFASSPWIATGTPDYVNLGYTSRGLAKQALMRLSRKSLAIFRKLGLVFYGQPPDVPVQARLNSAFWISVLILNLAAESADAGCWRERRDSNPRPPA